MFSRGSLSGDLVYLSLDGLEGLGVGGASRRGAGGAGWRGVMVLLGGGIGLNTLFTGGATEKSGDGEGGSERKKFG